MLSWKLILIYSMEFPCLTGAGAETSFWLRPKVSASCGSSSKTLVDTLPAPHVHSEKYIIASIIAWRKGETVSSSLVPT
jgi:hypothetical protein